MAFSVFTVFFSARTEPFYDFYGPFCKTSAGKGGSKMGPKDYIIFSLQYLCSYIKDFFCKNKSYFWPRNRLDPISKNGHKNRNLAPFELRKDISVN